MLIDMSYDIIHCRCSIILYRHFKKGYFNKHGHLQYHLLQLQHVLVCTVKNVLLKLIINVVIASKLPFLQMPLFTWVFVISSVDSS